jgi:hypothetical protein
MGNLFKIATMSILIVGTMCSTSCNSNDGILEEIEDAQPETAKWQEPYHTIGASVDQVKAYMAVSMKTYSLQREITSSCIQLSYSNGKGQEGILYSFGLNNGALFSVIDTESMAMKESITAYLRQQYSLIAESDGQVMFTNKDKDIIVNTESVSDEYFNVCYSFVSK